jgi:precorrin-6Y C5,15-methyltransferase (decarboxylating)
MSSNRHPDAAATGKWLSVIGIGEDGIAGLSEAARNLISGAGAVFGGRRHLALAAPLIRGEARPWPTPFDKGLGQILSLRGRSVCVLASGDPFHHGVGTTLARHVAIGEMTVIPHVSAFSLAAARLGWALQDVATISLHGRPVSLLRPLLEPRRRILALTSGSEGPREIGAFLDGANFGPSRLTVLEALGGPDERISRITADSVGASDFHPLNLVAVEPAATPGARILPLAPGLPDEWYAHDGQITKREIRVLALSALAPRHGDMLWDIGAGSGSVAIEWLLADPSLGAVAVERDPQRALRIGQNASDLGVPHLRIVEGGAPAALAGLAPPDAIFIGGGALTPGLVDTAIGALRAGGRLVVHAVTLETEALLLQRQAAEGGTLARIALSRASPVGSRTGWRPAMPVTQWTWTKP